MGDESFKKRWKVVDSLERSIKWGSRKFYNPRRINLNFRQNIYFRYLLRKTVNKYREFLPLNEAKLKKRWENYLPWLYDILVTFEKHPQSRGNRLFNILPERSLRPIFITIDKTILPSLYNLAGVKVAKDQVDDLWNTTFDLTRVCRRTNDRTFDHFIKTDGMSVSVILNRSKKESTVENIVSEDSSTSPSEAAQMAVISTLGVTDETPVTAVDPGRRDIYYAVNKENEIYRCSNREWRTESGQVCNYYKKKIIIYLFILLTILTIFLHHS